MKSPAPRFDDSKPRYCPGVIECAGVMDGPTMSAVCGCAIGVDLKCAVCCEERDSSVFGPATKCAAHCLSAAHYGVPHVLSMRGGWRDPFHVEDVFGEERSHGGIYWAELVSLAPALPHVVVGRGGVLRASGKSALEASENLRQKWKEECESLADAQEAPRTRPPVEYAFPIEEKTAPDMDLVVKSKSAPPEEEPLDLTDPETFEDVPPESMARALAVPRPGDTAATASRMRRMRAVALEHLAAWDARWAELRETVGGQSCGRCMVRARALREAEVCALLMVLGGVR